MLRELLSRWPVVKQIQTGGNGTGPEAMSDRTFGLGPRRAGAEVARSVCPYCGVGCGQLVYHKNNKLVSISACLDLFDDWPARKQLPEHLVLSPFRL